MVVIVKVVVAMVEVMVVMVKLFREGREGVKKTRRHGAIYTIANQSSTRT